MRSRLCSTRSNLRSGVEASGRIVAVNLDDTGIDIVVAWETSEITISVKGDSLHADHVRNAAAEVVEAHFAHLQQHGVIGEQRPGNDDA